MKRTLAYQLYSLLVDTFIVEVDLTKATFDDVKRDVETTRRLIS